MNRRQAKILAMLQWIFYPIAALMLFAFLADFIGGSPYWTPMIWGFVEGAHAPFLIVMIGMFYVVVAALLWQFLLIEFSRHRQRRDLGTPFIELYPPRFATRVVVPILTLVFVIGINAVVFVPETVAFEFASLSLAERLMLLLLYAVAHFLLIAFTFRAFRNAPFFVAAEEGFIYEPGDISPGLIRWCDISEAAEAALLTNGRSNIGGPRTQTAIVLSLKDPNTVFAAYNPLLRVVNALATRLIKYQTGGVGDIILAGEDFGEKYETVRFLFQSRLGSRWTKTLPD